MNIYLDVDGVLLNHDGTLANHADEFLAAMVHSGHPVHWLTTRCRDGDSSAVVAVLGRLVQPSTLELMNSIKPRPGRQASWRQSNWRIRSSGSTTNRCNSRSKNYRNTVSWTVG